MRSVTWLKGFIACELGKDHENNPHYRNTDAWIEWDNGWWSSATGIEINND